MKHFTLRNSIFIFLFFFPFSLFAQSTTAPNIIIVTTDGFRWREIFEGADASILNNSKYVKDTALLRQLFWNDNETERRKLLMPFVWNVIEKQGAIYGNRNFGNEVSISNPYKFSYAGYNELFTGYADRAVIANKERYNQNQTILDFINEQPAYKGNVAAFTSWKLFNYIFNKPSSQLFLNSGYYPIRHDSLTITENLINGIQVDLFDSVISTRNDMLTFLAAKEYMKSHHPKVLYIGFGETDEYAHHGNYDGYLQSAVAVDNYLSQLWYLVNSDPFYKNNTNLIVTTDHGRGDGKNSWTRHDMFTKGSSNTWLLTLGPQFTKQGELKSKEAINTEQIPQTIARLLGLNFISNHPVSEPVYSLYQPTIDNIPVTLR